METGNEDRLAICKSLGIESLALAHEIIVSGAGKNVSHLFQHGLNAQNLLKLGYSADGMRRLGYQDTTLQMIGYALHKTDSVAGHTAKKEIPVGPEGADSLKELIAANCDIGKLRSMGYTIHHFKMEGYDVRELEQLGFRIDELAKEFDLQHLKNAGFRPRDLAKYFPEHHIKRIFSAYEMKSNGYSAKELIRLGYDIHQIKTAGYSRGELEEIHSHR